MTDDQQRSWIGRENAGYWQRFHHIIILLMIMIGVMIMILLMILYRVFYPPLPSFFAVQPDGSRRALYAYQEPNLLPETILRWASKAATLAYTFDFVNYEKEVDAIHSYFTPSGWRDYLRVIYPLVKTVVQDQLFINGVVSSPPVISNQGPLPNVGYSWRVQIPFLVTYQSANVTSKRNFYVILMIVRVPTSVNAQGIGIAQFIMV